MSVYRTAVLHELADGVPRSASVLAGALKCAPAEVRKCIASLRELGADIATVPGKGYGLASPMTPLDGKRLRSLLERQTPAVDLMVLDEVDSTNAWLWREAEIALPASGRACIAEIQTAGKGRRGNSWYAAPGASLAFSMLWRFQHAPDFLAGLSLAAGVAVARVLHGLGAGEVRLKWPNDVVHLQRKLAGILVETRSGGDQSSVAVIGIGINLSLPAVLRQRIDQAVTDLAAAVANLPERNLLASMLLHELSCVLQEFSAGGFNALREEWTAMHAYHGRAVRLHGSGNVNTAGRVAGVAADGALLVDTGAGEQRFYSGEISLRAA
jgi:BirA family transcriptional regulator, biotin operon repressor / biotin---[acetyl-CoA-carboxylase] ligase